MKFYFILLLLTIPIFLQAQQNTYLNNENDPNGGTNNTYIGNSAGVDVPNGQGNTFLGAGAGRDSEGEAWDTYIGLSAGRDATNSGYNAYVGALTGNYADGIKNTFVGSSAGSYNQGSQNVLLGFSAGRGCRGNDNVLIGYEAGSNNNSDYNTFVGSKSGYTGVSTITPATGNYNAFFGYKSGYSNSTGRQNTFIGGQSGHSNSSGEFNTFVGLNSGYANTSADHNTFIGRVAGRYTINGGFNTFVGSSTGYRNINGTENTFLGVSAGYENRGGDFNTSIGRLAGRSNRWGNNNTYLGYRAGYTNTGHRNVFIGNDAGKGLTGVNDKLIISNVETNTPLICGDFNSGEVIVKFLNVTEQSLSAKSLIIASDDAEAKKIEVIDNPLLRINQINGIAYEMKSNSGKTASTKHIGFVASELKKVLPELVEKTDDGKYYINYDGFVPIIIEAMKEQNSVIESQSQLIEKQEKNITDLKGRMDYVENLISNSNTDSFMNNVEKDDASFVLKQNTPNPSSDTTIIEYEIPTNYRTVLLNIYDISGKTLLSRPVKGKSSFEFDLSNLLKGTYIYALVLKGRVVVKQKMVIN